MGSILDTLKGAMETVKKSKPMEGIEEVGTALKEGGKAALKKGKELGQDVKTMYNLVTEPKTKPKAKVEE